MGFYLAALALRGQPIDSQLVGALGAVVSIAEVAAALPIGLLTDRWSPRALLVLGSLLGAAATQLFGVSGAIAAFYIARRRVRVEHVIGSIKRCRIVKDTIRLWKDTARDMVMAICCGLHNVRLRLHPWPSLSR